MAEEVKLDIKDRKILSELDMDARQPLSRLAKKVGLSREVVLYRIRQLERRGVIQGYVTVLDTSRLGLMYCRMMFKYRRMSAQKEKELLEFCENHPNIAWVIRGEGKWDIVLVVLADSLSAIESVYDELNKRFGAYFQNPYISIAFKVHEFKHNYLYAKHDFREIVLGKSREKESLDAQDYKLLSLLSKNARMNLMEISRKLRISAKVAGYRIRKLLERKIILAFRARINTSLLGYDHYKVFLTLQNQDEKNLARIEAFLKYHPNVIYITKPMGTFTLEFEAMVRNANELHRILHEFRSEFGELLIDYDTYFTYEVLSVGYLPESASAKNLPTP